jgi:hypothetical protein
VTLCDTAGLDRECPPLRSGQQEQGEKIAPYVFKLKSTQTIKEYLDREQIIYEVYQEERSEKALKRTLTESSQEPRKKKKKIRRRVIFMPLLFLMLNFYPRTSAFFFFFFARNLKCYWILVFVLQLILSCCSKSDSMHSGQHFCFLGTLLESTKL